MKIRFHGALLTALTLAFLAFGAYAALNRSMAETLNEREDISRFRDLISRTHVVENLPSGTYTIIAPVNSAMQKLNSEVYPCFYSIQCEEEQAAILRNHIIDGEVNLADVTRGKAAIYSIDNRRIAVYEPTQGEFYLDGHKVLSAEMTSGGVLYVIDGVIANNHEIAQFRHLKTPEIVQKTTTRTVEPYPDSRRTVTTVTTIKTVN